MSFFDADYSAIQARIVNWLAGQEDALEEYRQGIDRYKAMASTIFNVPYERVNKHPQRFIGKQAILLCGFQGGPPKFRSTCEKFGYKEMPIGLEETAVKAFRSKHKKVVQYWYDLEKFAMRAIQNPGEMTIMLRGVSFVCRDIEGMRFLLVRLPSGRHIAYPRPRIVPSKKFEGKMAIVFYGHLKGVLWGDVDTYGGKLAENITMGVEADIMFHGIHNTEVAGYETVTCVHDQALAYVQPEQTAEEFVSLLTNLPEWADGLPIEAEGGIVPYYKKD